MEISDKKRLLDKIDCLDDGQLDRVESYIFGMEEQRQRLTGARRMRRLLKKDREHMIIAEDVS